MKHLFSFFLFLNFAPFLKAQSNFNHHISLPDTASSIFSQNSCLIEPTETVPGYDLVTGIYPYVIKEYGDSSFLTVKFPNSEWLMVRFYKELPYYSINRCERTEGTYGPIHLNLLPLYAENPGLFESATSGVTVQVRYQMYISIDEGPAHYIYSNIENIYLPPATPDDIGAFEYLKNNVNDIRSFSYATSYTGGYAKDKWIYLKNHFPNSIIADLATLQGWNYEYADKRAGGMVKQELSQWLKEKRLTLLGSTKSDLLRDKLKMFTSK